MISFLLNGSDSQYLHLTLSLASLIFVFDKSQALSLIYVSIFCYSFFPINIIPVTKKNILVVIEKSYNSIILSLVL